jgi:hypothetical protein
MENQKLEACYSEHSNTLFFEMLGEDENYQRLKINTKHPNSATSKIKN